MGEALEGLDIAFTELFTAGLVVLTFAVAALVAAVARRWMSLRAAVGIGVVAGAWSGFMSAGEILKSFDDPAEQLCPLLAFALVTCAARVLLPWPRARRVGFWVAAVVMVVQAVLMAGDLSALAAGRPTCPGQNTHLPQPRAAERAGGPGSGGPGRSRGPGWPGLHAPGRGSRAEPAAPNPPT